MTSEFLAFADPGADWFNKIDRHVRFACQKHGIARKIKRDHRARAGISKVQNGILILLCQKR